MNGSSPQLVTTPGAADLPVTAGAPRLETKHWLFGFIKTVALEMARTGITCNAIYPGYARTPWVEGKIEEQARDYNITREQVANNVLLVKQPTK